MAFGNATKGYVKKHSGGGGGGGTSNYNDLSNKPSINGVTLSGNKTSADLNITGGSSVVSYNENITTSSSETTYDLGAKLTELGFTGNDVAIITVMPKYEDNQPEYCSLYLFSDAGYNTLVSSRNTQYVGLCASLTTAISFYNTAKLKLVYGGGGTNHVALSIRIIKG